MYVRITFKSSAMYFHAIPEKYGIIKSFLIYS